MSEDFILDNQHWSFSSATSFEDCQYSFYLKYIKCEDQIQNFFSNYGLYVHNILEKYFKGELEVFELADYYVDHYANEIIEPIPPYPPKMSDNYFQQGLEFFQNFSFDKDKYEVVLIEAKIDAKWNNIDLIVKPDLILKDKETGKYILYDYKTAKLKTGKFKIQQLEEYKKQFYLYSHFLWSERKIEIAKIIIWFIRNDEVVEIPIDLYEVTNVLDWFEQTIQKTKVEEEWKPNLSKENEYFCNWICGVRHKCKFQLDRKYGLTNPQ